MKQYLEMKKKHPDAILLFRVGDFYETFSDDAIEASRILGITLTRRANGSAAHVELAGFPHHALDSYLPKLVRAGKRVAICEQLEDPKLTKKLVKRGITELITPGVNTRPGALPPDENNFLAALHFEQRRSSDPLKIGYAFLDATTGEFLCGEGSTESVNRLLGSVRPKEILRMRGTRAMYEKQIAFKAAVNELEDWVYTAEAAEERLTRQFGTTGLKGFGVDRMGAAVIAAGSILHYLDMTAHPDMAHIVSLSHLDEGKYMRLDHFTQRNLEIVFPAAPSGRSLFSVLNHTLTPMGSRMLKMWLSLPLLDIKEISWRQDCVEQFTGSPETASQIAETLRECGDITRLSSRVAEHKASPREVAQLANALRSGGRIRQILTESGGVLADLGASIPDLTEVVDLIGYTLSADPPNAVEKGGVIEPGVNKELDDLRNLHTHAREALEELQQRESERTGITSLKLIYTNVFGYALEVKNTHKSKVPQEWVRKQTLVNAERYVTPELRDLEERIASAKESIQKIEEELFHKLCSAIIPRSADMQKAAARIGEADCLQGLAAAARNYGYVRPVVDDSFILSISEGRHPVIERMLPPGEPYISNNVELNPEKVQIMMITGPNMSGKSALLRQTALIAIMAQCGSFVPAVAARIGLVDRVFTRVGASDNISMGESTFMVEMTEAAAILNNITARSLVLFDELGRGTSTYDGISIAWAVVEYIHDNGKSRPRTLFATHYHELNEMEKSFSRIRNFNVSVKEIKGKVVFLRKLQPGGSEHSFGIHVARLAGMPQATVKRAEAVLRQLEEKQTSPTEGNGKPKASKAATKDIGRQEYVQMSLFQLDDPTLCDIRDELLAIDINRLTPLEALTKLSDLRKLLDDNR